MKPIKRLLIALALLLAPLSSQAQQGQPAISCGYTLGSTAISCNVTVSTISGLTLVSPALGTPSSGVVTNLTGTSAAMIAQGMSANNYAAYCTGTAYMLTNALAAVTCGTTSPSITLGAAGTYFIEGNPVCFESGATFAAERTYNVEFFRTNNSGAALTSSPAAYGIDIVTTTTGNCGTGPVNSVIYTTANSNDIITIYADISTVPTAGSIQINGGYISAIRLY